jgi:hypothetical protein
VTAPEVLAVLGALAQAAACLLLVLQAQRCGGSGAGAAAFACGGVVFLATELRLGAPAPALALSVAATLGAVLAASRSSLWRLDGPALCLGIGAVALAGAVGLGAPAPNHPGHLLAALAALTALAASWPAMRATLTEPGGVRPLVWFVGSAGYGLLALAAMAARLPWPLLVFPAAAQVLAMLVGLLALDADESAPPSQSSA